TVARELNAINGDLAGDADVARKDHALAVGEGADLTADLNGQRRSIGGANAEHADRLEVRSAVAPGLHAPGVQMLPDVACGEPHAVREGGPAFELVGRDVGQPLPEVAAGDVHQPVARWIDGTSRPEKQDDGTRAGGDGAPLHRIPSSTPTI